MFKLTKFDYLTSVIAIGDVCSTYRFRYVKMSVTPSQDVSSQYSTPSSQRKTFALAGGVSMQVVGHGKQKISDAHMVIQLEFKFPNDSNVYKIGECLCCVRKKICILSYLDTWAS